MIKSPAEYLTEWEASGDDEIIDRIHDEFEPELRKLLTRFWRREQEYLARDVALIMTFGTVLAVLIDVLQVHDVDKDDFVMAASRAWDQVKLRVTPEEYLGKGKAS